MKVGLIAPAVNNKHFILLLKHINKLNDLLEWLKTLIIENNENLNICTIIFKQFINKF